MLNFTDKVTSASGCPAKKIGVQEYIPVNTVLDIIMDRSGDGKIWLANLYDVGENFIGNCVVSKSDLEVSDLCRFPTSYS